MDIYMYIALVTGDERGRSVSSVLGVLALLASPVPHIHNTSLSARTVGRSVQAARRKSGHDAGGGDGNRGGTSAGSCSKAAPRGL